MGISSHSQEFTRAHKARLHRQRLAALARRQQKPRKRLADQRHAIPGVEQLLHALTRIEHAQQNLRTAYAGLRALLTIRPLTKAFADFQQEGGTTAAEWRDWLNGHSPVKQPLYSKRHLRLIVSQALPASAAAAEDACDLAEESLGEEVPDETA